MSGQELPAISMEGISRVWDLKSSLRKLHGFPICMQQLLHDGCSLDDVAVLDAPIDILLVLKAPSTDAQHLALAKELAETCKQGDLQAAQSLLQAGANKDLPDDYGNTALMFAVMGGHREIARLLLEAGANKDMQGQHGLTALMLAEDDVEMVRLLLEAGAAKDLRRNDGSTALIFAARHGHTEIAQMLLEACANPDLRNYDGYTALMFTASAGHESIAKLLLEAGADKDLRDYHGTTASNLAQWRGRDGIARLLSASTCRKARNGSKWSSGCGSSWLACLQMLRALWELCR